MDREREGGRSLTSGEYFGQGLSKRWRGGAQSGVFGDKADPKLICQGEKARVVSCNPIIERRLQRSLMAHSEEMRLKKRSGAIEAIARSRGGDVSRPLIRNQHIT